MKNLNSNVEIIPKDTYIVVPIEIYNELKRQSEIGKAIEWNIYQGGFFFNKWQLMNLMERYNSQNPKEDNGE